MPATEMTDHAVGSSDAGQLWHQLREGEGPDREEARERIIDRFLPFARMLAAKIYANRAQRELEFLDFFQYASIGLIEAVDRFDPAHGVKFETFASPRITGAILDGIRSLSEKQEQASARKRVMADRIESLQSDAGRRKPNEADKVFVQLAELAIGLAVGFALEGSGMFQAEPPVSEDTTYRSVEFRLLKRRVESMVEELPLNEKRVIKHHYWQQLSFEEIARILGLTKGRISQIHREALHRIQFRLEQGRGIDFNF